MFSVVAAVYTLETICHLFEPVGTSSDALCLVITHHNNSQLLDGSREIVGTSDEVNNQLGSLALWPQDRLPQ